ncbi:MAG: hypothetical protein HWD59_12930 [Coxiellaceae bacterium]|nr:MAG: hypothetical protein HWD59_12930 [Coxiellaceae bacterium]
MINALLEMAIISRQQQDYTAAHKVLTSLLGFFPQHLDTHYQLGMTFYLEKISLCHGPF